MVGMVYPPNVFGEKPRAGMPIMYLAQDKHGCINCFNEHREQVGRIKSDYQHRARAYMRSGRLVKVGANNPPESKWKQQATKPLLHYFRK